MAITLTDIKAGDTITPGHSRDHVGCIIMNDDNAWNATCPGHEHESNGIGPFDGLPKEVIWLINRDFKSVKALQEANPDIKLYLSGWMRIKLEDMPMEWGIDDLFHPGSAKIIATVFDRVMKLSFETAVKSDVGSHRQESVLQNAIQRTPSLATGLRNLFAKDMDASIPKDQKVRKRINDALIYGVSKVQEKTVKPGEFQINCRIPRYTHARKVTSRNVPTAGKWQQATIEEDKPLEQMLPELRALNRPVLIIANVVEKPGYPSHDYLSSWVRPNTKPIKKISYTLEEVEPLLQYYDFQEFSVLVGPGWMESYTSKFLSGLTLSCGDMPRIAAASWSANVVAENILCGGFRKLSGAENVSPECVWLTVQDRLDMLKPIQSLLNCGAVLVSAYAGGISIKIPEDPEIINTAINMIWEEGLHLPIGDVKNLKKRGINIPRDISAYGGERQDLILGQCQQLQQRNTMWFFDSVMDKNEQLRIDAFRALLKGEK